MTVHGLVPRDELPPDPWWAGRFTRCQFDSLPDATFLGLLRLYRSLRGHVHHWGFVGGDRSEVKARLYDVAADADFAEYLRSK